MKMRAMIFVGMTGLFLCQSGGTALAGGARIVIRQGHHQGGGAFGQALLGAIEIGGRIVDDRLGNARSAGLPPASRTATPDPALADLSRRLDVLINATPQPPIGIPVPRTRGGGLGPLPPIPTAAPDFFPQ